MADYTPATLKLSNINFRPAPIWRDYTTTNGLMAFDVTHSLSGVVKLSNVPQASKKVSLYYRPTGALIKSVVSDSNGAFTFSNLDSSDTGNYFAIAFMDTSGYNALIFDKLTAG